MKPFDLESLASGTAKAAWEAQVDAPRIGAEADAYILARIAQGIGSSPSPDQLTRLHAAAARVLEGKP